MSEIALGGPHYVCVVIWCQRSERKSDVLGIRKHRLTMFTDAEEPDSAGRSQEHLP
jgi:hypothetical protein